MRKERDLKPIRALVPLGLILCVSLAVLGLARLRSPWSAAETETLHSLWLGSLPPPPPDPSNAYGDDPRAAALGQKLFFDRRFSNRGLEACASCHMPANLFQDSLRSAIGVGVSQRRTMSIIGAAYSPFLLWDGRKDSLWAQALGPMENPLEHGGDRTLFAHLVDRYYRAEYEALFGPLPDLSRLPERAGPVADPQLHQAWESLSAQDRRSVSTVFANIGKAIAAYERLLLPGESRFDRYVEAVLAQDYRLAGQIFSPEETAGLRLFIGRAGCIQCHSGPLFSDHRFHNTGVPEPEGYPADGGRAQGIAQLLADEFNCLGPFSDAAPGQCPRLPGAGAPGAEMARQFKPPSLRNVAERWPYMHAGQFGSLEEVLAHYNQAPAPPAGRLEIQPLGLSTAEMQQVIAFLKTLDGPLDAPPELLTRPVQ